MYKEYNKTPRKHKEGSTWKLEPITFIYTANTVGLTKLHLSNL